MSYISQVLSGGGGSPIGSLSYYPYTAPYQIDVQGQTWLRTGVVATASGFPIAQTVKHLRVFGTPTVSTGVPLPTTYSAVADNNTGTAVISDGNTANTLYVTTNYGAAWTTATTGASFIASDVVFANGTFIAVGNTTGQLAVYTSTNGTTWTAGGTTTLTSAAANSASVTWLASASLFVIAVGGGTSTTSIFTTPTGAALTARTFAQTIPATTNPTSVAASAGRVIVSFRSGNNVTASSTDGVTWGANVNVTLPAPTPAQVNNSFKMKLAFVGTNFILLGGQSPYWTSTDGSSWTYRQHFFSIANDTTANQAYSGSNGVSVNSSGMFLPVLIGSSQTGTPVNNGCLFTTNGIDWEIRQFAMNYSEAVNSSGGASFILSDDSKVVFVRAPAPSTLVYVSTVSDNFVSTPYVGVATLHFTGGVGTINTVGYVRIK